MLELLKTNCLPVGAWDGAGATTPQGIVRLDEGTDNPNFEEAAQTAACGKVPRSPSWVSGSEPLLV